MAALALFAAVCGGSASANDVLCPLDLGAVEVDGNLLVVLPCKLEGTVIHGNVQLFAGSSLAADRITVHGNVEGTLADFLILFDSNVDGQVRLTDMVGNLTRISLSSIGGNLELDRNRSRIEIEDNRVDGNVDVDRNSGGVLILDNVIGGNLVCRRNDPSPVGGGNHVSGRQQAQCSNLLPEDGGDAGDEAPDAGDGSDADDGSAGDDGGTGDEPTGDDPGAGSDDTTPEEDSGGEEEPQANEEPAEDAASDGDGEPPTAPGGTAGTAGPGGTNHNPDDSPADAGPQGDPSDTGSTNGSSGGATSDSGSIVLNPQPSGGGAAFGLFDLLLVALLLLSLRRYTSRGTRALERAFPARREFIPSYDRPRRLASPARPLQHWERLPQA